MLLAVSMLVYTSNLNYSLQRVDINPWKRPDAGQARQQVTADMQAVEARVALLSQPTWIQPLLKDLSTISPGLAVVTALQMLLGALRLMGRGGPHLTEPHFPFHDSYKTYYVQLGLIGTVVGFVLAFSEIHVGPESEANTLVLLDALGTALWSTLCALVLAYLVCPLIEFAYAFAVRLRVGDLEDVDPTAAVKHLSAELLRAANALGQLSVGMEETASAVELRDVKSRLESLERTLTQVTTELATIRAAFEDASRSSRSAPTRSTASQASKPHATRRSSADATVCHRACRGAMSGNVQLAQASRASRGATPGLARGATAATPLAPRAGDRRIGTTGWPTTAPNEALPNCRGREALFNLAGNVAEWCIGGMNGSKFDARGGCWRQLEPFMDPAMPGAYEGTEATPHIGFRLLVE
ncbi:MAG: hypothetical protein HOK83_10060 [Rhodospirillaceae bacterium]|jgi:hypothetical protein|nr:hypothetical protein [Rhodospirillaceae bacterium]